MIRRVFLRAARRAQDTGSAPAASTPAAALTNVLLVRANVEGGYYRDVPLDPGTPFPTIALQDESGEAAAIPTGEVLYGFFKTTCPTCELAWPYLDRIGKLAEGGGLSVLAVSQDDPEATARFYEDLGVAVPTLYDREPWDASEAVQLENVPTFFLVGRDGIIRDAATGFQRHKMEEFAALAADRAGRHTTALFLPGDDVPAMKPG
jgi:peroxiredoxin